MRNFFITVLLSISISLMFVVNDYENKILGLEKELKDQRELLRKGNSDILKASEILKKENIIVIN